MASKPDEGGSPVDIELPAGYHIDEDSFDENLVDQVLANVRRRQRAVPALMQLITELDAQPGTGRVEATDTSGMVRTVLAADGLPGSITVDPEWRRLIGADGFAGAVTQACQNAALAEFTASPRVDPERLERRMTDIMAYLAGDIAPPPGLHLAPPAPVPTDPGGPLWTAEAADAVNAELSGLDARIGPTDEGITATTAQGRLSLNLQDGVVTCEADPDWVARQSADELSQALASALASLVAERAAIDSAVSRALSAPLNLLAGAPETPGPARGRTP